MPVVNVGGPVAWGLVVLVSAWAVRAGRALAGRRKARRNEEEDTVVHDPNALQPRFLQHLSATAIRMLVGWPLGEGLPRFWEPDHLARPAIHGAPQPHTISLDRASTGMTLRQDHWEAGYDSVEDQNTGVYRPPPAVLVPWHQRLSSFSLAIACVS